MARTLIIVFFLVMFCTGTVSALVGPGDGINITVNSTGWNYILWRWDNSSIDSGPYLAKTIFINQEKVVDNTTLNYYLLTDINPAEEHIIEIRGYNVSLNTLNNTVTNTTITYEQDLWTPLLLGSALVVLGWFTAPIMMLAAFPVFLFGFAMARELTNQSYILLTYGLGTVFSMIAFALRVYR